MPARFGFPSGVRAGVDVLICAAVVSGAIASAANANPPSTLLNGMKLNRLLSGAFAAALLLVGAGDGRISAQAPRTIPRTADRRPNLDGIWQVRNRASIDL